MGDRQQDSEQIKQWTERKRNNEHNNNRPNHETTRAAAVPVIVLLIIVLLVIIIILLSIFVGEVESSRSNHGSRTSSKQHSKNCKKFRNLSNIWWCDTHRIVTTSKKKWWWIIKFKCIKIS